MKLYHHLTTQPCGGLLHQLLRRIGQWFDRERELVTLRNTVGMMSEARRRDAAEYEAMARALATARERIVRLENSLGVRGVGHG